MRRLSKMAWLVLGIGIFIIAFASLYMLYHQQGQEQKQLKTSVAQAQTTGIRVNTEKSDWQSKLTEVEGELAQLENELIIALSQLASSQANLPASAESIEYDERLFEFSNSWRLDIVKITASEPSDEEWENVVFRTTSFDVTVRGAVDDILAFINTLVAHPDFVSASVESVVMEIPAPLTESEMEGMTEEEIAEEMGSRMPSATIGFLIYSYQGE